MNTPNDVIQQHLASMGLADAKLGEPVPEKKRPTHVCTWHWERGGKCNLIAKHSWPDADLPWLCDEHYRAKVREKQEWDEMDANARAKQAEKEMVRHPDHYGGGDNPYEVIKVLRAWGLTENAHLWNVVKYVARAGKKDPSKTIQDLEKARFYLDYEINLLKEQQKSS